MDPDQDRTDPVVRTSLRGSALLNLPLGNRGTAFTVEERAAFGLEGLLPHLVSDMELQVARIHESLLAKGDPLEMYIGLVALQDRNEVLFYRLLLEHIETYLPVVYTPTVGLATQRYSEIFRRPRGIWLTPAHRGRIEQVLAAAVDRDVRLIVATDGERILGLGDQGAGGMAIPIGKLALYTVGAGIHPGSTLPVCLDVGTDNETLLANDLYLGWRQARLRGPDYDSLVEEFVMAVEALYPRALLQWEDFKKVNAMTILERYRNRLLSFNDDIQGTAAVALAGVLAGVRATGVDLVDHRIVVLGAGAAGAGIAVQLGRALSRAQGSREDVARRIGVLDSKGLLTAGRRYRAGEEYKQELAWPSEAVEALGLADGEGIDLERIVTTFKPTILIGASGQPDAFTEPVVRAMASHCERPLIFPFSNPTSKSEGRPEQLVAWTEGRAWIATGSPFDPVTIDGRVQRIGQGNNVYIFPGVGLGALVAEARSVSEEMFTVAAECLGRAVTDVEIRQGLLYPELSRLREVSREIALAVAEQAVEQGLAPSRDRAALETRLDAMMWEPVYPRLEPA